MKALLVKFHFVNFVDCPCRVGQRSVRSTNKHPNQTMEDHKHIMEALKKVIAALKDIVEI